MLIAMYAISSFSLVSMPIEWIQKKQLEFSETINKWQNIE